MNTQNSQKPTRSRMLEEKLKTHVQREFTLGEKVIALLKEKQQLEADLQEQLTARHTLEKNLEDTVQSKEVYERKFTEAQKALKEQRELLRHRSQRIVESEESSQEQLNLLQLKIRVMEEQMDALDKQKVEEHVRLSRDMQELRQKEQQRQQELQQLAQQKELVEHQLRETMRKFRRLSSAHHGDQQQYEQRIQTLLGTQIESEAQIKQLQEEQRRNEHKLRQEIESLKISNAQLEEQLKRLNSEKAQVGSTKQLTNLRQDIDADLLKVIEKQDHFIRDLKDKAHQRSTLLRSENEVLRQEMEKISSAQEKFKWENQMLETTLKGLQQDLVEYLQLKNTFEEVQKEKERFETIFQRKLQIFEHRVENRKMPTEQSADTHHREKVRISVHEPVTASNEDQGSEEKPDKKKSSFLQNLFSRKRTRTTLVNVISLLFVVVLAVVVYKLFPWEYVRMAAPTPVKSAASETPKRVPEIQVAENADLPLKVEGNPPVKVESVPSIALENTPETFAQHQPPAKSPPVKRKVKALPRKNAPPVQPPVPKITAPPIVPKTESRIIKKRPADILVQLSDTQAISAFYPPIQPLPTIENNIVLRHRYEQKNRFWSVKTLTTW